MASSDKLQQTTQEKEDEQEARVAVMDEAISLTQPPVLQSPEPVINDIEIHRNLAEDGHGFDDTLPADSLKDLLASMSDQQARDLAYDYRNFGLTEREFMFAYYYLQTLDAEKSALRAGYAPSTAKDARKWVKGQRQHKKNVAYFIAENIEAHIMDKSDVLLRLAEIADGTAINRAMEEWFGEKVEDKLPTLKDGVMHRIAMSGKMHLVKKMKFDNKTGYLTEIEFHDRLKALELAAKTHALLVERNETTVHWRQHAIDNNLDVSQLEATKQDIKQKLLEKMRSGTLQLPEQIPLQQKTQADS